MYKYRFVIISTIVSMFYGYQYTIRATIGRVFRGELTAYFNVGEHGLGWINGAQAWTYALVQIPVGILVDMYPIHKTIPLAMLMCALGNLIFIVTNSPILGFFGRLLFGASSAFAFITCIKTASMYFSNKTVSIIPALTSAAGYICSSVFTYIFAYLSSNCVHHDNFICGTYGIRAVDGMFCQAWKSIIIYISLVGIVLSIIFYFIIKKYEGSSQHKTDINFILDGLRAIIGNRQCWVFGLYAMLTYTFISVFVDYFGLIFFQKACHMDSAQAVFASSLLYGGSILGGPLLAHFSNIIKSRKYVMAGGAFVSATVFSAALFIPMPNSLLIALMFIASFLISVESLSFVAATEVSNKKFSATANGFVNMICSCSAGLFQPFCGMIIDFCHKRSSKIIKIAGSDMSTQSFAYEYRLALLAVVIAILIAAFLIMLWGKETYLEEK